MLTATPPRPARSNQRPERRSAPPRTPATRPRAQPLRVVTKADLAELRRRRRARAIVGGAVAIAAFSLFGVVVTHVLLMQGQFELERLQRAAVDEQAEYDRLRLEVAARESPDEIVAAAQQRLAMIVPPTIRYLAPSTDALPADTGPQPSTSTGERARSEASAPPSWATVKRHLDEG